MIKSDDLFKGMLLSLGDDVLTVKEIRKEKVKTIAICLNQKGKKIEKTVSELYYGHAKVLDPKTKKPIQAKAKPVKKVAKKASTKKVVVEKERKKTKRNTLTYMRRSGGIVITARDKDGNTMWSSWQRIQKKAA